MNRYSCLLAILALIPVQLHAKTIALPTPQQTVVFSSDGKLVTSIENGHRAVVLRDTQTGKVVRQFPALKNGVNFVSISPDSKLLATTSHDQVIRLWNVATGKEAAQLKGHQNRVLSVHFHPNGETLVSTGYDRTIRIWDIKTRSQVRQFVYQQHGIHAIALSPSGDLAAAWGYGPTLLLIDLKSGKIASTLSNPQPQMLGRGGYYGQFSSACFSPDGEWLAVGAFDRTIHMVHVKSAKVVQRLAGHQGFITSLAFSGDGKHMVSTGWDASIKVWEVLSGKLICQVKAKARAGMNVAFSPNGQEMAWNGINKTHTRRLADQLSDPERPTRPVENLWRDLSSSDARTAHQALWTMVSFGSPATDYLSSQLKPVPPPDASRIDRLIGQLDSNEFAARQNAMHELNELGELAGPALGRAIQTRPSLEVHQRIGRILAGLTQGNVPPERLQKLRAIQALEYLGTPAAKELLKKLGGGAAGCRITREARASLSRLARN